MCYHNHIGTNFTFLQTGDDIKSDFEEYISASYLNITRYFLYELCYDSVWTLAFALNGTLNGTVKLIINIYV